MQTKICVILLAIMATSASAAFVGGVENFNGTTLDTSTWEYHENYSDGSVAQNNVLTINAPGDIGYPPGHSTWANYTTTSQQVSIGETVTVKLTLKAWAAMSSGLFLTDNSAGTGGDVVADANWISLQQTRLAGFGDAYYGFGARTRVAGVESDAGHPATQIVVLGDNNVDWPAIDETVILKIEYATETSAILSVLDSNNNLIYDEAGGGMAGAANPLTVNFSAAMPDDLYVSLAVGRMYTGDDGGLGISTEFDEVTIVPEPATIGLLCFGSLAALLRGRRKMLKIS